MTYTITAERSNTGWVLRCEELPDLAGEVQSLPEADAAMRVLISETTGAPPEDVELVVIPFIF